MGQSIFVPLLAGLACLFVGDCVSSIAQVMSIKSPRVSVVVLTLRLSHTYLSGRFTSQGLPRYGLLAQISGGSGECESSTVVCKRLQSYIAHNGTTQ